MLPDGVVRRALEGVRSSARAQLRLVVSKLVVVAALGFGANALLEWIMRAPPYGYFISDAQRISRPALVVGAVSATVIAWSVLSSLQRAASIALADDPRRPLTQRSPAARGAVVRLAIAFAAVDCLVPVAGARMFFGALRVVPTLGDVVACYVAFWIAARGLAATAMGIALLDEQGPMHAIRASLRELRGHRWAHIASRGGPAIVAGVAALASRDLPAYVGIVSFLVLEPVIVAIDSALEAAWHLQRRASASREYLPTVFE